MSDTLVIRLDPLLKEKAAALARMEGKTLSRLTRDLFRQYIKERDIEGYIDQLWTQIGEKLEITEEGVERAIEQVRSEAID